MSRDVLTPPKAITMQQITEISELIVYIEQQLMKNEYELNDGVVTFNDPGVEDILVKVMNRIVLLTGKNFGLFDFREHLQRFLPEDVAKWMLSSEPPRVPDLTVEEIAFLIQPLLNNDMKNFETHLYFMNMIKKSLGIEDINEYIYYPDNFGLRLDASALQIAEKMLENKNNEIDFYE